MVLATWNYDEQFPVIPPRFTYDNKDEQCQYLIRFNHSYVYEHFLPSHIDINLAVDHAVRRMIDTIRYGETINDTRT